ncbi:MAG: FG-GAP repeat protein [Planctomycetota bacterium]|jgi:hypothetical protein
MRRSFSALSALSCSLLFAGSLSAQAAEYWTFGDGCAGTSGVPVLGAAPESLPQIDGSLTIQFSNLPPSSSSTGLFGILGFSRTDWAGITLPANMGPFGMPGCTWYVAMRRSTFIPYTGTTAQWTLSIRDDISLLGLRFYNQGLVLDPAANDLGAVMTKAGAGEIGLKPAEAKITAFDMAPSDHFGSAVALSKQVALIGSIWDDDVGSASGAAYIYERDNDEWVFRQKLLPDSSGEAFGTSVAIRGDRAIVGAYATDGFDAGAAWIYEKIGGTWERVYKITRPAGVSIYAQFGAAVDIENNMAVVGAPSAASGAGEMHVYYKGASGWGWIHSVTGVNLGDNLGSDVAVIEHWNQMGSGITDYVIAAGAPGEGVGGAVHVLEKSFMTSGWFRDTLVADDAQAGDNLGSCISMDGFWDLYLLAGASGDDDNGAESGSAYLFRNDLRAGGWVQHHKLLPDDGAASDGFGGDVSVAGDAGQWKALVGARWDDDMGNNSGSAYLFKVDSGTPGWTQLDKFMAYDGQSNDGCGGSVALDEHYWQAALLGASGEDPSGMTGAGSVYPFTEGSLSPAQSVKTPDPDGSDERRPPRRKP